MGTIPHYQTAMNLFASPPILHIMVGASNVVIMFIICMLTSILALNLEMKNLALALAKDEIEEKNRTLEERIQERTEDLEEKNKLLENALLAKHELKERLYIKERMSELGKFVADATHAIKTPLSVIGIRMEETQRKLREGEEVVEEDIKQVSSEVKQLGEFVLNLLKYYGPEAISKRIVNLNNLLNMSLSLVLEKDYLNCDIEVRKEFCTDEEPLVEGDFYQLQHALMNVIGNAIESMSQDWRDIPTPDYFQEMRAIRLPVSRKGKPIYLNPNLPFQDINRLNVQDVMSSLSPFLKAPLGQAIGDRGYSFFLDRPIESYRDEPSEAIPAFFETMGIADLTEGINLTKKGESVLTTAFPTAGKVLRLVQRKVRGELAEQVLTEGLGIKVMPVDALRVVRGNTFARRKLLREFRRKAEAEGRSL